MTRRMDPDQQAKREYAQLLRMHERLLTQLARVREEIDSPGTRQLLRDIRNRTGDSPEKNIADVIGAVEESIRALKLSESEIHLSLLDEHGDLEVDGVPNLPAPLARFLAERRELPGFTFEVQQDEVRGWVIAWKEYTTFGTVRGYGQFYERPYAWLDE